MRKEEAEEEEEKEEDEDEDKKEGFLRHQTPLSGVRKPRPTQTGLASQSCACRTFRTAPGSRQAREYMYNHNRSNLIKGRMPKTCRSR